MWGATSPKGKASAIANYHFEDVLSAEEMLQDLRAWDTPAWAQRVGQLEYLVERAVRRPDMSLDNATRLARLAAYEAVFAAPGFTVGSWGGGDADADG